MKPTPKQSKYLEFIEAVKTRLQTNQSVTRPQLAKVATQLGITDKTVIKELTELTIVEIARNIAASNGTVENKYQRIVELYKKQSNISFKTSESILLNQYSTPAPIAYLMGIYSGIQSGVKRVFEPSAGNGMLTIAAPPKMCTVNEIDRVRNEMLQFSPFNMILKTDASYPFNEFNKTFDAVLLNPPFGSLGRKAFYHSTQITALDHWMVFNALETMRDNGKAAFIIGGHLKFDHTGRISSGKNRKFFNQLCHRYQVDDIIPISGKKLYSKQGTGFNVTLVLVGGRKKTPSGAAPLIETLNTSVVDTHNELFDRIQQAMAAVQAVPTNNPVPKHLSKKALDLLAKLKAKGLEAPYIPTSKASFVIGTEVPDAMVDETEDALEFVQKQVGGDIDNFVRDRLGYPTKKALYDALSAEQIDAVALGIFNLEALPFPGLIIGDQTGIGKGRVAASLIRYGVLQGLKPIFITEKPNLFSDLYRDLIAIGSVHLVPFIVNSKEAKTTIKDEDGITLYEAPTKLEQEAVFRSFDLKDYDFVMATYSQFNSTERSTLKAEFLKTIAEKNLIILDESHNASGSSNTGNFLRYRVKSSKGTIFLSATFAKRPDNLPIYAAKTCISEAAIPDDHLVDAIKRGGVALQEILSAQLVAEGQMIRREKSYEGIEVNYLTMLDREQEDTAIADNITSILRAIIEFQNVYVDGRIKIMDEQKKAEGVEVGDNEASRNLGVDNVPYFSKVFQVVNQMLFSIKANAVADRAIERLKEGKKPVIAFSNTMGSFLENMSEEEQTDEGKIVGADFSNVLLKGLEGVLRYTVTDFNGDKIKMYLDLEELSDEAQQEYRKLENRIKNISTGICISPIDIIVKKITQAGYKVGEVTGRKVALKLNEDNSKGMMQIRKRANTNDAFRQFNNNDLDVLLINQAGSTGASAHAIPTAKIPKDKVKQRVMIILQAELNIDTEIQKRGRINRTGQIYKPIYDYIISSIPAETRLMMMLQKKLKSLDANTSSNQKQSATMLSVDDFLNKYGDQVVEQWIEENPNINDMLGNPLRLGEEDEVTNDKAMKVSGRVAILSVDFQKQFYDEINERYRSLIEYLKQTGEYDLEVETLNLEAATLTKEFVVVGKGGYSPFGRNTYLEKCEVNILTKPYKGAEVKQLMDQALDGLTPDQVYEKLLADMDAFMNKYHSDEIAYLEEKYARKIAEIGKDKKLQKLNTEDAEAYLQAFTSRKKEVDSNHAKLKEELSATVNNRRKYLTGIFKAFKIGQRINYPVEIMDNRESNILGMFLGFKIDKRKKNPYAPSAVLLRFALASSQKYLEIPASMTIDIQAIRGASVDIEDQNFVRTLLDWDEEIREFSKDRADRYIITGNILQGIAKYKGKLVNYTLWGGGTQKGILLPESFSWEEAANELVTIPIEKAAILIKSLPQNKMVTTTLGLSLIRKDDQYRLIIARRFSTGGQIFMNQKVLQLVENGKFESVGKNMEAYLNQDKISDLIMLLQDEFNDSIETTRDKTSNLIDAIEKQVKKEFKIRLPGSESAKSEQEIKPKIDQLKILKMRAKALLIKQKLLNFKNRAS